MPPCHPRRHRPVIRRSPCPSLVGDRRERATSTWRTRVRHGESDAAVADHRLSMGVALQSAPLFDETQRLPGRDRAARRRVSAVISNIQQGIAGQARLPVIVDLVGDKLREVLNNDIGITWFRTCRAHPRPGIRRAGSGIALLAGGRGPGKPGGRGTARRAHPRAHARSYNSEGRDGAPRRRRAFPGEQSFVRVPIVRATRAGLATSRRELRAREHAFRRGGLRLLTTVAAMGVALESARATRRSARWRARRSPRSAATIVSSTGA